jgi:hypothetical protein
MEFDLDYLAKLAKSIQSLLEIAEYEEEEDSLKLHDARNKVKHQLMNVCIDCGVHKEFIDSYLRNFG